MHRNVSKSLELRCWNSKMLCRTPTLAHFHKIPLSLQKCFFICLYRPAYVTVDTQVEDNFKTAKKNMKIDGVLKLMQGTVSILTLQIRNQGLPKRNIRPPVPSEVEGVRIALVSFRNIAKRRVENLFWEKPAVRTLILEPKN